MVALWTTHWPIGVFIRISQLLSMEWTHMPPRVLVVNMDFHRKHTIMELECNLAVTTRNCHQVFPLFKGEQISLRLD